MSFDPTKLAPFYRFQINNINFGVAATKQVLLYNPYRVAFLMSCTALGQLGLDASVVSNTGLGIANPDVKQFSLANLGTFVQQPFWFNGQAGANLCIVEVLWVPPGGIEGQ